MAYEIGSVVRYRCTGEIGSVIKILSGEHGTSYKVLINGRSYNVPESSIEPFEDEEERIFRQYRRGKLGGFEHFKEYLIWYRLSRPLAGSVYSLHSSKTIFNPHQYKPLWRFISPGSEERLYIADEVGVGKTIESGLIIKELQARNRINSRCPVLVVCPNALVRKWSAEMRERFSLEMEELDGNSWNDILTKVETEGIYPSRFIFAVTSLQLLRRQDYLDRLESIAKLRAEPLFGLVIIDECHHMRNMGTLNNRLGKRLSELSDMMLMLSATPLNLDDDDLYNQLNILNPLAFPDKQTFQALYDPIKIINRLRRLIFNDSPDSRVDMLRGILQLKTETLGGLIAQSSPMIEFIERLEDHNPLSTEEKVRFDRSLVFLNPLYHSFTRTRKREAIEHQVRRKVVELPVKLSEEELSFQTKALHILRAGFLATGYPAMAIGLMMNIYRRMVSSSIPAFHEYIRSALATGFALGDDNDTGDDVEDDTDLAQVSLDPVLEDAFRQLLTDSRSLAEADSKYEQFSSALKSMLATEEAPQIIVFSFFVKTLEYLHRRLEEDGIRSGIIHGGIPTTGGDGPDRFQVMDSFKAGKFDVLLSSEVGGEGLDFQYCHALINYDLPYNPMRVEQRIGRIDRFGQKADRITIVNMYIRGTVDEEIYERLYKRVRLAEDGVGAFEPILGQTMADAQNQFLAGTLTEDEKEEISIRLEAAIESAKAENESYESSRKELLGEELNGHDTYGHVAISPDESLSLTQQYLSGLPGCKMVEGDMKTAVLELSEMVLSRLGAFATRGGNEGAYYELRSFLSGENEKRRWNVLFDGNNSEEFTENILLPPAGFWMRFIAEELVSEGRIHRVFKLQGDPSSLQIPAGNYAVFIYEGRVDGSRAEIKTLVISVNIETGRVDSHSNEMLTILLNSCSDLTKDFPHLEDIEQLHERAQSHLLETLKKESDKATVELNYRIDTRIKALTESCDREVSSLKQQMKNHESRRMMGGQLPSEEYLHMTDARVRKKIEQLEVTKKNLETNRVASFSHTLEGTILLACW